VSAQASAAAASEKSGGSREWVGSLLASSAASSSTPASKATAESARAPNSSSADASQKSSSSKDAEVVRAPEANSFAGFLRSSVASSSSSCSHGPPTQPGDDLQPPLVLRDSSRGRRNTGEGEPVWLHIYDVSGATVQWVNNIIRPVGTGAFHAGVEVFGQEWSFGYATENRSGVYQCRPRCNTQHKYRESVEMGTTKLTEAEVTALVEAMRKDWLGYTYDLLVHNCCHFSDTLLQGLGCGPAPKWVMNLAGAGAKIVGGVDQAVASAHAARGLAAAIDEHYQITPSVEAFLSREFEIVDEDYVREKAQDLWANTVASFAPVNEFAENFMDRAQQAVSLRGLESNLWKMWAKSARPAPRKKDRDNEARVVKVSLLKLQKDVADQSDGTNSPQADSPASFTDGSGDDDGAAKGTAEACGEESSSCCSTLPANSDSSLSSPTDGSTADAGVGDGADAKTAADGVVEEHGVEIGVPPEPSDQDAAKDPLYSASCVDGTAKLQPESPSEGAFAVAADTNNEGAALRATVMLSETELAL